MPCKERKLSEVGSFLAFIGFGEVFLPWSRVHYTQILGRRMLSLKILKMLSIKQL